MESTEGSKRLPFINNSEYKTSELMENMELVDKSQDGPPPQIETYSKRFLMLTIFALVAVCVNAAERTKLWFRDEVTKALI